MARELRNVGASVRQRLLDRARAEGADFQNLLTRYALERLLYRLSVSEFRNRFVLKGAMLFAAWVDDPFRPTGDLDLLGFGDDAAEAVAGSFLAVCAVNTSDDGVEFDGAGLTAATIREGAEYGGVRLRTTASIGGARVPVQIDIGYGDAVSPGVVQVDYPTLLGGEAPRLQAYPPETVVAEKFQAMVSLGAANTRLKDFYDLWLIAQTFPFDAATFSDAIERTFERRRTVLPAEPPVGLSDRFSADKARQWRAFLGRERLAGAPHEFSAVIEGLRSFLLPPLAQADRAAYVWAPGGPWLREGSSERKDHQPAIGRARPEHDQD